MKKKNSKRIKVRLYYPHEGDNNTYEDSEKSLKNSEIEIAIIVFSRTSLPAWCHILIRWKELADILHNELKYPLKREEGIFYLVAEEDVSRVVNGLARIFTPREAIFEESKLKLQ